MNGRFKFRIKVYYENNDYMCVAAKEIYKDEV